MSMCIWYIYGLGQLGAVDEVQSLMWFKIAQQNNLEAADHNFPPIKMIVDEMETEMDQAEIDRAICLVRTREWIT